MALYVRAKRVLSNRRNILHNVSKPHIAALGQFVVNPIIVSANLQIICKIAFPFRIDETVTARSQIYAGSVFISSDFEEIRKILLYEFFVRPAEESMAECSPKMITTIYRLQEDNS
jgi:hypothetical protein